MATKNEKLFGTIFGTLAGAAVGYLFSEVNEVEKEDRWKYIFGGAVTGGVGGFALTSVFGLKNDTVNYQLLNGRKRVYHGITYEDRVDARKSEHLRSGKIFTQMIVDSPKPRIDALSKEKRLIQRDRPVYNKQHKSS